MVLATKTTGVGAFLTSSAILLRFAPQTQLMHEITNLKNLVSNAEVYNEELEVSLSMNLCAIRIVCKVLDLFILKCYIC